jgi:hypothetical protein
MKIRIAFVLVGFLSLATSLTAQTASINPASTQVPAVIQFSDVASDEAGSPLSGLVAITFSLYNNARGGEPLWTETQNVQLDSAGRYSVYLGITRANGVPISLFSTGQAHWLGVTPQGQPELPRVFLVSVPYAMKAGDAATVGGLPPSAFVLAAPGGTSDVASGSWPSSPTEPTPGGTGTQNYIPIWTDNSGDLGNSVLYQVGTGSSAKIGINLTKPLFTLDVNGTELMRGLFEMATTGFATASQGFTSNPLNLESSAYNSATKKYSLNHFQWQAEPTGNNTTSPGATLNLLYGTDPAAPVETGLKLSSTGLFTFASGQTFPGAGTITGVTAGTDLTGGGSSGKVTLNLDTTKVPQLAGDNTFSGLQTINNAMIVSGANSNGELQVTNTATSGNGSAIFALAESSDTNGIASFLTANSGSGAAVLGESFSQYYGLGIGGVGGTGVMGTSSLIPFVGVRGIAFSPSNTGTSQGSAGVWGDSNASDFAGVLGTADDGVAGEFLNNSNSDGEPALYAGNASFTHSDIVFETDGSNVGGVCTIDVKGDLACTGSKSAVVPVDGGRRNVALYAVEAPENWFEDFGSGHLGNGAARVIFDSTYVQTVNTTSEYHVFLTPRGECEGLYVANETPAGFEVRELHHGTSNVNFDYRIVARRIGYENIRLADFTERYKRLALKHEQMRQRRSSPRPSQP